jgi:LPS export ABC transporter protein LptC
MGSRIIPGIILAALAAAPLLGCGGGAEPSAAPSAGDGDARLPEQQFFDYRLIESTAGVRQWVLDADEMRKYADSDAVELTTVHMDFYRAGEHFSVLTSDSGTANLTTRDVHTWGNVVVVTDDGRRLETEELFFSNETQLITNEVFNRFTRNEDVLTGIGLEATPDLEYIEIKADVEADVGDAADTRGERP